MRVLSTVADMQSRTDLFFEAVQDAERPLIAAQDVSIVVAHPDDESITCGALMPRLRGATVVMVTDGAPRDGTDARANGFDSPEDYAAARLRELKHALFLARIPEEALVTLSIPDQQASFRLAGLANRLADFFFAHEIEIVLTHAFEGGHPDHDAAAFGVHAARELLLRQQRVLDVVEMPLYRLGSGGRARQSFAPSQNPEIIVRLSEEEQAFKRRLLAAHTTQHRLLGVFDLGSERFRRAPHYNLAALPNEGRLLYEQFPWGMTGERGLDLAREALDELGLRGGT